MSLVSWILLWGWFPPRQQPLRQPLAFFSHYREIGSHGIGWYVLGASMCQQMVFFAMCSYLAAYLMQTYHLPTAATALPLALVGSP
jgi:predicted MFS family arabinose efflux permease